MIEEELTNQEDSSLFNDDMTACETIELNMRKYSKENIISQCCHVVDGLKQIHRRIIWTIGTSEQPEHISSIAGQVMNKYHPHGDMSIYDAIVRLMQPFNMLIPLIDSDGSIGTYNGERAAAGRYLNGWSSPFARDLFFTNVNTSTFRYKSSESYKGMEPCYLIPRLPSALLIGSFGLAVGYKSDIPSLNLSNVCDLVMKFIENRKKSMNIQETLMNYAELFIPDFPIDTMILNKDQLVREYKQNNFNYPVLVEGSMVVGPSVIILRTIHPGVMIDKMYEAMYRQLADKNSFASENFTRIDDLSTTCTHAHIEFTLKRGVDPFSILDKFKKSMGFTKPYYPSMLFSDSEGNLKKLTPIDLISIWYNERYHSILSDLNATQKKLTIQHRQIMALVIVADYAKEVFEIFNTSKTKEDTVIPLCKKFGLTKFQAEYLASLRIHQITQKGKDDLIDESKRITNTIKELQTKFSRIDDIIVDDCQYMKNKYGKKTQKKSMYPGKTIFPDFIGCVKIKNQGVIQFRNEDELHSILTYWYDSAIVEMYPKGKIHKYVFDKGVIDTEETIGNELPKEFACSEYLVAKHKLNDVICLKQQSIYRLDTMQYDTSLDAVNTLVGKTMSVVNKDGLYSQIPSSSITKRVKAGASGVLTDIVFVSDICSEKVIVVHGHEKESNTIRMQIVTPDTKLKKVAWSGINIIGIYPIDRPFVINVPKELLSRCNVNHVFIENIELAFSGESFVKIFLNKKILSNDVKFTSDKKLLYKV